MGKMEKCITYRKGSMHDIDLICQMVEAAKVDMDNKGINQWDDLYPIKQDFEDDIKKEILYVAEGEYGIVGIYVISQEADEAYDACEWENEEETACILHRLCVAPQCQNQGVGKQILQAIEKQAKGMLYESIRLDVFSKNPHALNLYKKSSYVERGFADWRKGRFILMEKKL